MTIARRIGISVLASLMATTTLAAQAPQAPPTGGTPQLPDPAAAARNRMGSADTPIGLPPGAPPPGMGPPPPMAIISGTKYMSGIAIKDGSYNAAISAPSAVAGGKPSDTVATGISIISSVKNLNGVFVQGNRSAFTLSNATINLTGAGRNDFLGIGAGAMAAGGVLIIRDSRITTNGTVRSATIAA